MKIFLGIICTLFIINSVNAAGFNNSKYYDAGLIYSGTSFPQSAANQQAECALQNLKTGEAECINILGFVETGDASINTAAKNGGITKIHYIDYKINKVYIPILFIPIYAKEIKTVVYGE